jgi:molybdate transport system substrate-binding protein
MAATLHVLSSMATKAILVAACDQFAHSANIHVRVESVGGVDAAKRVRAGEIVDIVLLASNAIDSLIAEQFLSRAVGRCDWVRSGIAVAISAGTPVVPIANAAQVTRAVEQASRICYSTGPSGAYLEKLFESWPSGATIKNKTIIAPPGVPVASLVASGQAQIGFQQLSELVNQPGITVLGELPPEIQLITTFSAGLHVLSPQLSEAQQLLAHLTDSSVHSLIRQMGMEPATQ